MLAVASFVFHIVRDCSFTFGNYNPDILHYGIINIWGLCLRGGLRFPVPVGIKTSNC